MSTNPAVPAGPGSAIDPGSRPAPPSAPSAPAPPAAPVLGAAQGDNPPPPRDSKAPRRRNQPPSVGGIAGLPPLLELGSNLPLATERHDVVSTFIPSAVMYFMMVGFMDERMIQTDRFTRSNHSWIPVVSHVYFSIIWLWHTLRVARESGVITQDALDFLQICEQLFDFRSLLVPGPLTPFLTALSTCSGPFEWFGDVSPYIPSISKLRITRANGFAIHEQWLRQIPNPAVSLDLLLDFGNRNITATSPFGPWTDRLFSATPLANNPRENNRLGPNFVAPLIVPQNIMDNSQNYWSVRTQWFPARFTAGVNHEIDTWGKFFGFTGSDGVDNYEWFTAVTTCMQTYATFFRGTVPLQNIPTTGLGACIPTTLPSTQGMLQRWIYPDGKPSASETQIGRRPPSTSRFTVEHYDVSLGELPEQYAEVTMVNMRFDTTLYPDESPWTEITMANNHRGPVWTLPIVRRSGRIRTDLGYGQIVASRYHSATSLATS